MEIETRSDGTRFKVRPNGRKSRLCNGKNNTCTKESKKAGKCTGCTTGNDKTAFADRAENDRFTVKGIRYKYIGGQSRKLCNGDNDTCENIRSSGELCHGHHNGTAQTKNKNYNAGDKFTLNGKRYLFNGTQKVLLCNGDDKTCEIAVTKDGMCKKHSDAWKCKFTELKCDRIGIFDGYCTLHQGNITRSRIKSKGEQIIADILDKNEIEYESNQYIKTSNDQVLYLDFMLKKYDIVIEYDGKQHFESIEYWGGDEGLEKRQQNDAAKDQHCIDNKIIMVRIRYDEKIEEKMETLIETLK